MALLMRLDSEPVHPRGRGEHCSALSRRSCEVGSSPRARGTPRQGREAFLTQRFIPAGAGNTADRRHGPRQLSVHPRGRGEHDGAAGRRSNRVRFIPAGAGNTKLPGPLAPLRAVHPRGRGEHGLQLINDKYMTGSSPRARGTRRQTAHALRMRRFIPAGAGNTALVSLSSGELSVHPRGRGEHGGLDGHGVVQLGSSPRARGTHWSTASLHPCAAVHPRGRGEHFIDC